MTPTKTYFETDVISVIRYVISVIILVMISVIR